MLQRLLTLALVIVLSCGAHLGARADDFVFDAPTASYNDFGNTGLLQHPTARMAPDGELFLGGSRAAPYTRYMLGFQFLPWLQGTFRYTDIANREYGREISDLSFKDKGVDLKLRLVKEDRYWPDVSVAFRDVGGTGLFSSEYILASRRYRDFDFSLGLAWGNAGTRGDFRNPLRFLSSRFESSRADTSQDTGILTGTYFRGPNVALVGGIEYQTPIDGVRLKLELDGNSYAEDPLLNNLPASSRFNYGIEYRPFDWLDLSLAYERGNTVMVRTILHANNNKDRGVPKLDVPPPPPVPPRRAAADTAPGAEVEPIGLEDSERLVAEIERHGGKVEAVSLRGDEMEVRLAGDSPLGPDLGRLDRQALAGIGRLRVVDRRGGTATWPPPPDDAIPSTDGQRIVAELALHGMTAQRYFVEDRTATLVFTQERYLNRSLALGRAARVVAANAPSQVEVIKLVLENGGLPVQQISVSRQSIERGANHMGSAEEAWMATLVEKPAFPSARGGEWAAASYPAFGWDISPHVRESVGGPDNFLFYQFFGTVGASLRPVRGLTLSGAAGINLYNNFDDFKYDGPSLLPRVRTDIRNYLVNSEPAWIENLYASYAFPIAPDWYGLVSGGLFEMMYGGVAGEILYRPTGKRWAVGLDLNHVRQRDFDGRLALRDYNVTTGHLTYYQHLPWHNLFGSLSVGRYLAKDVGATVTLGRHFDNGIEVGAWATKTNVSAAEFGEGGFDKGFFISVPLELFTTTHMRSRANFAFRPLTRDGGQKVGVPASLYGLTGGAEPALQETWRDTFN